MAPSPLHARRTVKRPPAQGGVAELSDELELAIQWNRPAILLAVTRTDEARRVAQRALERQLESQKQKVTTFRVDAGENVDVPASLGRKRNRDRTVYFIEALSEGGTPALRALNLRREYLVDKPVRAVFWLSEEEEGALAREAPDFWAFRQRVVYFQ